MWNSFASLSTYSIYHEPSITSHKAYVIKSFLILEQYLAGIKDKVLKFNYWKSDFLHGKDRIE